jgi:thiol:disulfide interchange protein DsbC
VRACALLLAAGAWMCPPAAFAQPPAGAAAAPAQAAAAAPKAADPKAADAKAVDAKVTAEAADAAAESAPLLPCPPSMGSTVSVAMPPLTPELAADIRERVHRRTKGIVTSVCRTPWGLYEVVLDAEIFYVDERANYLIAGNVFDLHNQENITAQRKEEATRIDFKSLPLDLAVKTVRGNGSRVLAIFEDPNCPYCKRFEKDIAKLNDATIYTFLYPILSRDPAAADDSYPKSRAIWCAPDRAAAWSQLMLEGKRLAAAPAQCKHPLEEILTLGQKLHVTGTPTLVFADGRRSPGAIPLDKVERMLTEAGKATAAQ